MWKLKHSGEIFWEEDFDYIKDICKMASDEDIDVNLDIQRSRRRSRTKSITYDVVIILYRFSNVRVAPNQGYPWNRNDRNAQGTAFCSNQEFCNLAQNMCDRIRNLALGLDIKVGFRNRRILKNEKINPENPTENLNDNVDHYIFTIYQTKQPELFNKF